MSVYGSGGSGAGTSPGGSDTEIQYNDTGSFAGDSKLTYDSTNGSVTLGGATVTADSPVLSLSQTWNNGAVTFTGIDLNVTDTASASDSKLLALQVEGTTVFDVQPDGSISTNGNIELSPDSYLFLNGVGAIRAISHSGVKNYIFYNSPTGGGFENAIGGKFFISSSLGGVQWRSFASTNGTLLLSLERDDDYVLAQRVGSNAQTFRCYGTYTDSSNYVRASLSADSTSTTLAAETAGTGADDVALNLTAAGAGTVKVKSVAEVAVSSTVAGLPSSPTVGMISRVTDADTPSIGSTVTGSGSSAALVWYNGTNWTVIGV